MKPYGKSRRVRRDRWISRMATVGTTLAVMFLVAVTNIRGADLKRSDLECSIHKQSLEQQKEEKEKWTAQLQECKIYVKTKQYVEEVAKEKLGLVNPDEILLKPTEQWRERANNFQKSMYELTYIFLLDAYTESYADQEGFLCLSEKGE